MKLATVVFLILGWTTAVTGAMKDASQLERALGVFTSLEGADKIGTLAPGQTILVHVKTDGFDVIGFDGMISAQFAVNVDPRLDVVATYTTPEALFINNPSPNEWLFGLQSCAGQGDHPLTLVSYELTLADGVTDLADLRVDVGPLPTLGEPMLFGACQNPSYLQRFANAGGAIINPSDPSVVHFSYEPEVVVEGRDLTLAWETVADATTLDGAPVARAGRTTFAPPATATYLLEASTTGATVSASRTVEVIREPRVLTFSARVVDTGSGPKAQLAWDVLGANNVDVPEVPGIQFPYQLALVPIIDPPVWELTATNEWGTTTSLAGLSTGSDPPLILSFTANPNPFRAGSTVTLHYSLFGATSASIEPGVGSVSAGSGSVIVDPGVSTTYTLTASNDNGSVSSQLFVQLLPPGIASFTADPSTVYGGYSTTLQWETDPGLDLLIEPGVGVVSAPSGSVQVTPPAADTAYTLTASNAEGSVSTTLTVGWKRPDATLTAASETPFAPDGAQLTASIEGAFSATLEPGFGAIDPTGGTFSTDIVVPTTFVLTATNLAGTVTQEVTVTPRAPAVSIAASDESPLPGQTVTLTVTIEGAEQATLEPGIGAIDPAGGTFDVQVDQPTLYQVTATNAVGSTSANVLIVPSSPEATLTASAEAVVPGEPVVLTATVIGADSATLEPGFGNIAPEGGMFQTLIDAPTTFVLTATNAAGTSTAEVFVGLLAPVIEDFSADLPQTILGQPVTLSWNVRGAESIAIEPGGFTSTEATGQWQVNPTQTTVYTLTASNAVGTSTAEVAVAVQPFAVVSFTVDRNSIEPDDIVTFTWEIIGEADVQLDPLGPVAMTGSLQVQVPTTTTFVLRATNGSFTQSRSITVHVTVPGLNGLVLSWSPVEVPGPPPGNLLFTPFNVYVLALGLGSNLAGFEFFVDVPSCVIVLGGTVLTNPGGAISVGTPPYEYIVGIGQCIPENVIIPLVRLNCLVLESACAETAVLSLGPSTPSSFNPPTPGYLDCSGNLVPFNVGPDFPLVDDSPPTVPAAVLGLQASGTAEGVELAWEVSAGSVTTLDILRARDGGDFVPLATLDPAPAQGAWTDRSALPEVIYTYLAVAEIGGLRVGSEPVRAQRPAGTIASRNQLLPNRPNPFNPVTELRFTLDEPGSARVAIYDLAGRQLRSFAFESLPGGEHAVTWDATDDHGRRVASGVYVVRLDTAAGRDSRRITLLK